MTPAHTDSPLRRSEAGIFREPGAQNQRPLHNDDEEERQARRRTLLSTTSSDSTDASTLEQSENLKKCLEIYHENKLSRDNAWSLSLIDTLSTLLERHHKSLNNFTVAGSSLEASTKVYGLRVDSVHMDVLRMSAGLNARKFRENANDDDDDGVATGGEGNADPNSSANTGADQTKSAVQKRKKQRKKTGALVTKNKETLNARLDTVPMQDPVFGKLNSTVGSINASNRLMINMLQTVEAELRLRMTHKFWDAEIIDEDCDYTEPVPLTDISDAELLPCERLSKVERFEKLLLRPTNSGYVISDTPIINTDDRDQAIPHLSDDVMNANDHCRDDGGTGGGNGLFDNRGDPSMAFDINAECEPLPQLDNYAPILAVDEQDFDEYTAEEHNAIGHCRGLRKAAVVIEDMRPVDSTTNLEYSYRPVEKISQFWAGPSHWRFRRTRHRSTMGQSVVNSQHVESGRRATNQKRGRPNALQSKKRLRVEFAIPIHDALFVKLDSKYKSRKANFQKKWDQKKLRLPTDLQLNAQDLVNRRSFAPAFAITDDNSQIIADEVGSDETAPTPMEDEHFMATEDNNAVNGADDGDLFNALHDSMLAGGGAIPGDEIGDVLITNMSSVDEQENALTEQRTANDTVLEIATDYEGAPRQVTKIVVPFAKRAKVIDMKCLKRTCTHLISQQLKECAVNESQLPIHPIQKNEHYSTGCASFQQVYKNLPNLLAPVMAEGLSTSIALYSVLHLANDLSYRLIPQEDLEDFSIRQVVDD